MALKTFSELRTKLQSDMDITNEPFLPDAELVGYMNEAVADAETAIHTMGIAGGYFLTPAVINFVLNQQAYSLPSDIYANKIMAMFYQDPPPSTVVTGAVVSGSADVVVTSAAGLSVGQFLFGAGIPLFARIITIVGTTVTLSAVATASGPAVTLTAVGIVPVLGAQRYMIRSIKRVNETMNYYPGDYYRYQIVNSQLEAGGNQLLFYPVPASTGPLVFMWYMRQVRALTTSLVDPNNVLEIRECENFLFAHVKWNIALKSGRMVEQRKASRDEQYTLMMEKLREMIPDADNQILLDLSAYYDQEVDILTF